MEVIVIPPASISLLIRGEDPLLRKTSLSGNSVSDRTPPSPFGLLRQPARPRAKTGAKEMDSTKWSLLELRSEKLEQSWRIMPSNCYGFFRRKISTDTDSSHGRLPS